jgi:hypothetical protein
MSIETKDKPVRLPQQERQEQQEQLLQLPFTDAKGAHEARYAAALDAADPLRHLRNEFIIPTRADLQRRSERERPSAFSSFFFFFLGLCAEP